MSKEFPPIEESLKNLWSDKYCAKVFDIFRENVLHSDEIILNYAKGVHYISHISEEFGEMTIARFGCTPMSGCYAILLFHSSAVNDFLRGLGIGKLMHEFRVEAAKMSGFSYLQCTTNKHNDPQNAILNKSGWEIVKEFKNVKTGNTILYWMKNIAPDSAK